ncbi:MAG: VOC family protein [Gammaproteobacteria bacterium]|nr:VOC family protein [Gammaproteobacteria bacterium]MCZ6853761.1 VOC family protein [Gammaproteobacteria bacterium]
MIKLEHANISATDVEAMTQFITTAIPDFGIRHEGLDSHGRPWRHVGNDEFYIAVSTVSERGSRKPYSNVTGLNHLGWEVDDVAALEERMIDAGYRANLKDHGHPARRRTYFYDPDGNDWEFVQYLSDDPAERNDYYYS